MGGFHFCRQPKLKKPLKAYLPHAAQIQLLKSRGLDIPDDDIATRALKHYGYYRLAGYSFPLRAAPRTDGTASPFRDGASIDLVCQIAEFDKSLRLLVLNAIETVEIACRVAIAYYLGRFDPKAHLNPKLLDGKFCRGSPSPYDDWIRKHEETVYASKEDFVLHHQAEYGGEMPIWVSAELWSFGMLSRFYDGMQHQGRAAVATQFGGLSAAEFSSWLRNLAFARNVAAHHARLWNRTSAISPSLPSWTKLAHLRDPITRLTKIYTTLCLLRVLLQHCQGDVNWHIKLKSLANSFPATSLIDLTAAGFPTDWQTLPLWV